uniref:PCI domain-containing protein n=1 Tax=Peronospora matthiolae TaxID=2874970 RepID=A0AAV1VKY1_9STRA
MQLAAFVDRVGAAIGARDGSALAQMMNLTSGCTSVDMQSLSVQSVAQTCQDKLARFDTYAEVVAGIMQARKHVDAQRYAEAYDAQIGAVMKFMEIFREETNWVIPFVHVLFVDTRLLAARADFQASEKAGSDVHDSLRSAEQHLKKGFAMTANDRAPPEHNKKMGALFIVNQLFKIYFKLNMIHLCRNLIRAVEGPAFPPFELFNKSDKVTYQYYVGRISMFEDQYKKAETCLDYAWKHCHRNKTRNKRMILQFLVPVKLLLGVMPSPKLLSDFSLGEYTGLTNAIRGGNLHLFTNYVNQYQDKFIHQGVYLLIEKLRLLVLRNLFKKVYLIQESHQLQMQDFQLALHVATGHSMDMDEIECVLTNLIFKGYIKGYMSHTKKILVVSKTQPFPPIVSVAS